MPVLTNRVAAIVSALAVSLALVPAAQTRIEAPANNYSVADDVRLGREAAAEVAKELPLLRDTRVDGFVADVGRTLVAAIPPEFRHAEFAYTFEVVNQKEINAFALPGGPMFLNRGMIEAGQVEGEVAGVMAHEISHVALRHGTAQATKGQRFQIGSILGQIAGAIVGGATGSLISQGTQFGLGAAFLRYGREYETQADILGAQILARAGYDPREMAEMFKTIEAEGGSRGPEWLSSHPNPGNRYDAINREAALLRVQEPGATGRFAAIRGHLAGLSPAFTAEEIARGAAARTSTSTPTPPRRAAVTVAPPDSRLRRSRPLPFLRLSVPSNWSEVSGGSDGATYAPEGGYVVQGGNLAGFTHGVQVGLLDGAGTDLRQDTDRLIATFSRSNPDLRRETNYARQPIAGRTGLAVALSNVSSITGQRETISLGTVHLDDGRLLYLVGVAPQSDARAYEDTFRRIRQSAQINGR